MASIPQDNCGTTYFAIQFQGVNQLGFGDYADGFAPTCTVADDFNHALGDPAENQLEVALGLRNTGMCTAPTSVRAQPFGIGRKGRVEAGADEDARAGEPDLPAALVPPGRAAATSAAPRRSSALLPRSRRAGPWSGSAGP